ncbi:MAG: hypothetical protein IM669_06845 [Phenylobacterium sp.]|uniref:hypothetical protein n=1 Tax=Phenylobacterium sp. TaxID=1871053 RepID=UPI0025EE9DE9|nr:hypothetical protein [Phenylobacterium sp.]MCA3757228.1 hypothetical protein [Phenylobacterium sp.]
MRDRNEIQKRPERRNDVRELTERLEGTKRLSASDKAVFAGNLGDLAARISPDDPLEGAKRIVMKAGLQGLWPTKRKKYFRLPDENAPNLAKDGDYASSPLSFMTLAEAAGELLNKSNRPEDVEGWRAFAIKKLLTGSTFMPSFVPSGASGQSAKQLLDEYASVLAEAVKSRTRITELWSILEDTPIGLGKSPGSNSAYGGVAEFPGSLLDTMYRDPTTPRYLSTEKQSLGDEWAEPCLEIGRLTFPVNIWMYRIPEDKRPLFVVPPGTERKSARFSNDAIQCLVELGFDLEQMAFPVADRKDKGSPWIGAMANLFLNVGLKITHYGDGEPRIKISLWGDLDYAVLFNPQLHSANVNRMMSEEGIFQSSSIQNNELYLLDFIYDRAAPLNEIQNQAPIGILPMFWYWEEEIGWEVPPIFRGNEAAQLCELLVENNFASGWTDEEFIARVLMSGDAQFHPIIPESLPTGGVLPAGSVGAALLQNARSASPPNRITQLLVDRVALTAEVGLRFYDAMVEDARAAIHRI